MTQHTELTLNVRPANERGMADHGWLNSAHTFSFAQYHDPAWVQFGALRVINDDRVSAGMGFGAHPHQDAEIFSYVLDGALSHKDSMGNGSTVEAGGVQYMSAGNGVTHSEFNPSQTEDTRFLQVWLLPRDRGGEPRYDTAKLADDDKAGKLKLFLSPDGDGGSMATRADARVYAATLEGDQEIIHDLENVPKAWVQVARGTLTLNGVTLQQGDGVAIERGLPVSGPDEVFGRESDRESGSERGSVSPNSSLRFTEGQGAEILLFELLQ